MKLSALFIGLSLGQECYDGENFYEGDASSDGTSKCLNWAGSGYEGVHQPVANKCRQTNPSEAPWCPYNGWVNSYMPCNVPACSNSVSRTDSSWGWGGSSSYNQEEPQQDYNRDYPVSNNNYESDFGLNSRWEDSNQNTNRGVRPGAAIDEDIGAFTSERTTTTVPPTTTTTRRTTTTTRRVMTTTRRRTNKPLIVSRTKPMIVPAAPAHAQVDKNPAQNPSSDWRANYNAGKLEQKDHFPEVLPLSPPPKDVPESSTNENAEISSNQKLTKMHIQAGNASSLTLEVNNTIHIDTSSMVQILSVVVVIIAFIVFGSMICRGVRLSKFDKDIKKIPTDVKMLKTKVDTLHNAFVSQADVNTISEGLHGYVNQENEIEIKKGVMNSAFSFVESSYEKSPEKITTTVQRF
jgi:hypothetical protein